MDSLLSLGLAVGIFLVARLEGLLSRGDPDSSLSDFAYANAI